MPILLKPADLEPGMCLARNVVNSYSVLLPHGHTLKERDILSLSRRIPGQFVEVIDPLLDQMVEFQDNSHDQNVSQEVRKNVASVVTKVTSRIRSGIRLDAKNITGMKKVIEDMVAYMTENPVTMALIEQSQSWDDYLQHHSSNVFYLSLLIGNTIRNYIREERERLSSASKIHDAFSLTSLATSAMFFDIGMVPLEKIYHKEEPLTQEEKKSIQAHPEAGAAMLPDGIDPMVKLITRSHHENHNGTGYPLGLAGDRINIFARIIRVADAYSSAISDQVYRKAKSPAAALYEMLHGSYSAYYDPVVLKVFSGMAPPFPIGAKLILQNGQCAVVVRHNNKDPFRPLVVLAYDEFGDPLPKEELQTPFHLGQREDVHLKSFAGEDLTFLNEQIFSSRQTPTIKPSEIHYQDMFDFVFP